MKSPSDPRSSNGRQRVVIEAPAPAVDLGRYPAKRIVGERVVASCDLVSDGHDAVGGSLLYRGPGQSSFTRVALVPKGNDRFEASFVADAVGRWEIGFEAWVDAFATWLHGVTKKVAAGQDVHVEMLVGAKLLAEAADRAQRASDHDGSGVLRRASSAVGDAKLSADARLAAASAGDVVAIVARHPDLENATKYERTLPIVVDRKLARFGSWYEFFPRSCGAPGKHGTFADAQKRLDYVAEMGFDVVYLPPIHPIGRAFRKGKNNTLEAGPDDVGSPWAIGSHEGGHKAVHPQLGTLDDFRAFVRRAKELGIEVAIDIAFQASPDHPWVKEHPTFFRARPDGTIQYAENPPKKYQDVYPFDFETKDWQKLWEELLGVFTFWIDQGITVFRVDNPHTKALPFWEWCIARVKETCPEAIFLAEAFTRPKLMYGLAKAGFSQSYTYFTWRQTKHELTTWMEELTRPPVSEFYRPNFWPNTPDILPEHLQHAKRPAFLRRLILAATLSSSYGIYGPPFELMENVPRPGAEEYIDNEKFQLRTWDLDRPDSLRDVIARVNQIRRENPALQDNAHFVVHRTDNDQLLCFSKSDGKDSTVLVVVNLGEHRHSGWIDLDLGALGVGPDERFQVHDELSDERYHWSGHRNYVEIDPNVMPAHVFRVRRKLRTEHDFEYFL
jgi:starch synthase (maltosyl-transferring)